MKYFFYYTLTIFYFTKCKMKHIYISYFIFYLLYNWISDIAWILDLGFVVEIYIALIHFYSFTKT